MMSASSGLISSTGTEGSGLTLTISSLSGSASNVTSGRSTPTPLLFASAEGVSGAVGNGGNVVTAGDTEDKEMAALIASAGGLAPGAILERVGPKQYVVGNDRTPFSVRIVAKKVRLYRVMKMYMRGYMIHPDGYECF